MPDDSAVADRNADLLQETLGDMENPLAGLENRRDRGGPAGRPDWDAIADFRERLGRCEEELRGLREAMRNRGVIEQAKGMLMLRLQLNEDKAFDYLRNASNLTNRKLAEVAAHVVRTRAGDLPG